MPTSPYNILVSPATGIWLAPVGEAYPLINVAPAGNWVSLGRTDGGVKVKNLNKITDHMLDQVLMPVKRTRTAVGVEVTCPLAEITLEVYAKVLNNVTVTTVAAGAGTAGYKYFTLGSTVDVSQFAMLIRGPSPYMDANLQYELKCVSQGAEPELEFTSAKKAILNTVWSALEDPSVAGSMGRVVAEHAAPI